MLYNLKDNRTGAKPCYGTTVEITEEGGELSFVFRAEHSSCFCAYEGYNRLHCEGDACEVFIGTDPERRVYYEIEISPRGEVMLARVTYNGEDPDGNPSLALEYIDENFLTTSAEQTETGYTVSIRLKKDDVRTGEGEFFFNAYRLETDGGEMDKHLFALCPTMCSKFHVPSYYGLLRDFV